MFKDLKGFVGYVDKNDISTYRKIQKFQFSLMTKSKTRQRVDKNRSTQRTH